MTGNQLQLLYAVADAITGKRGYTQDMLRFNVDVFRRACERDEVAEYHAALAEAYADAPSDEPKETSRWLCEACQMGFSGVGTEANPPTCPHCGREGEPMV